VVNLSKSNKQPVLLKGLSARLYVTAYVDELDLADSSRAKARWNDVMQKAKKYLIKQFTNREMRLRIKYLKQLL